MRSVVSTHFIIKAEGPGEFRVLHYVFLGAQHQISEMGDYHGLTGQEAADLLAVLSQSVRPGDQIFEGGEHQPTLI